jgi:HK97 gp10 family phage protein
MDLTVDIKGVNTIVDRLSTFPSKVQRREARRAARRGAFVFRDAVRANARRLDDPRTKESIAKNVVVQESRRQSKAAGGVVMRVGIQGGARKVKGSGAPGGDTYYWRFLEFGTSKMPARPFMRPAFAGNEQAATDATATELSAGLDRLLP